MVKNQSLREAVTTIMEQLKKYQYSKNYLDELRRHFNRVLDIYENDGWFLYDEGQYQQFLAHIEKEYAANNVYDALFWYYRKCAYYLDEYFRIGEVHPLMIRFDKYSVLNPEFRCFLDQYILSVKQSIRSTTLTQRTNNIQRYLFYLQSNGHKSFDTVSAKDIQEYFSFSTETMSSRTFNSHRLYIRQFHHFLSENHQLTPPWISILDFHAVVPRKLQGYLSLEEIEKIMSVIDTTTDIGKRDYAIISLVKTTGLRGIDIIKLNLSDIDWRLGTLSIIQSKTDVKLHLPLLYETGEALRDYILNGRPISDSKKIFLRAQAPYRPFKSTSALDSIINKFKEKAGISKTPWDGKSFHGVRRGLGRELILADVPVTSVMQVFGHSSIDSTKPYIMLHTHELKECALDLRGIPLEREELINEWL